MLRKQSKIISNKREGDNYFEIALESPEIADICLPGQFIEVKVSSSLDPLLRRPFSIHRIGIRQKAGFQKQRSIVILYEVVGKGTEILSQNKPGEYLDIIGPLGHGFVYQSPIANHQLPILVAGGMGVAPLLFLAETIKSSQFPSSPVPQTVVLIGAKTKAGVLCEQEFRRLGCDVQIATDDGSQGFKGKVTDLLDNLLSTIDHRPSTIYSCGPKPMLKALTQISKQYNIPAQISLESHMACGIGACLGCVVNTSGGFKRVCKDGPVFNAEEIIW